jgi:hypothetical protein
MILLYVAPQVWFYVQTERTQPGASSIVGDAGFLHLNSVLFVVFQRRRGFKTHEMKNHRAQASACALWFFILFTNTVRLE